MIIKTLYYNQIVIKLKGILKLKLKIQIKFKYIINRIKLPI